MDYTQIYRNQNSAKKYKWRVSTHRRNAICIMSQKTKQNKIRNVVCVITRKKKLKTLPRDFNTDFVK